MKRICSIILVLCMCMAWMPAFANSTDLDTAIFEVTSLGIFEGDGSGDLKLENTMTRAEFAKVIVVLSGMRNIVGTGNSPMKDVPADHWASGYIDYLITAGLMNGYPDGTFRPDATITLDECLKTILVVMGYEIVAKSRGGYPDGYYSVAVENKLVKGVVGHRKEAALRKDIIMIIYRALDVPYVDNNVSPSLKYYEKYYLTLRNTINKLEDLDDVTGIVTATSEVWLNAPNKHMEIGQIEINGHLYDVNPRIVDMAYKYIGQEVVAFYKFEESMLRPYIHNIQPTTRNEVIKVQAENVKKFSENEFSYKNPETGDEDSVALTGETRYIYNDRPVTRLTEDYKNISCGYYTIVDNDYDSSPEYVFAGEYTNYMIEKANSNGNVKVKYNGEADSVSTILTKSILFDFKNENSFAIKDANGKKLPYETLQEGMIISVYKNNYDSFMKVVVSDKDVITNCVTKKTSNNSKLTIDGTVYTLSYSPLADKVKLNEFYDFYIDAEGRIAFVEESPEHSLWKYGYIYKAGTAEGIGGNYEAMIIEAGKVVDRSEPDLENPDAVPSPITLCQNNGVTVVPVAKRINADGKNVDADEIESYVGAAVLYALDTEGNLRKLESVDKIGGADETTYYAKEKILHDNYGNSHFMIDADTQVLCIPTNSADEGDLMVQITLRNNATDPINAYGYDVNEETNAAKLLIIKDEMNKNTIEDIVFNTAEVAVISDAYSTFDENGDEYMSITLLAGGVVKTIDSLPIYKRPGIKDLKAGDIVFYKEDANGKFDNAEIVNNVHDAVLGGEGTSSTFYSQYIGYAEDVRMNQIGSDGTYRMHEIKLITDEGFATELHEIKTKNLPDIFIYDVEQDEVTPGTIDDIIPYAVPVENPETLVVLYTGEKDNGTMRAIVIMR